MNWQFAASVQGVCDKCKEPLTEGGYLNFSKTGLNGILCKSCHEKPEEISNTESEIDNIKPLLKQKKYKLIVKKLSSIFSIFSGTRHYEVLSAKNIMLESNILDEKELADFMDDNNVNVDIKF